MILATSAIEVLAVIGILYVVVCVSFSIFEGLYYTMTGDVDVDIDVDVSDEEEKVSDSHTG